jgi:hypothetical protein
MSNSFLPNYRTTDHVFTLLTLIDKQTKTKSKSSHALLISQKVFESIWNEGVLYKLMESGVCGSTYISMYWRGHFFPQGRGVRQGCSLSPTLFNIYINVLARALEKSAAPGLTRPHPTRI